MMTYLRLGLTILILWGTASGMVNACEKHKKQNKKTSEQTQTQRRE